MTNTKLYATVIAIVVAAATTTGCGNVSLKGQGGKTQSSGKDGASEQSGGQGHGKGVRFALALPESFEDDGGKDDGPSGEEGDKKDGGEGDVLVEDSPMADEFADAFESERILVTCDGEPMAKFADLKGKKLRGIFELTLTGKANGGGNGPEKEGPTPQAEDPSDKEDTPAKAEPTLELTDKAKGPEKDEPKPLDPADGEWADAEEPANEPMPEDNYDDKWDIDYADVIAEHVAVPFTCPANATVEIVDLEAGYDYVVEANLYSAWGGLRYTGATDVFTAGETKAVDLIMSPVQSTGVSINVIFADAEAKKAAKK